MRGLLFSVIFSCCCVLSFGQAQLKETIYTSVEHMPEFPGGMAALQKYLSQNIKVPKIVREDNLQGKTIVKFIIDRKGKIRDIKVTRSISEELDKNIISLIENMPEWEPGRNGGEKVSVEYLIPINIHYSE